MEIVVRTQPAPTIDPSILAALAKLSPRIFMVWNARWRKSASDETWEPRWEIWSELDTSQHPDARNVRVAGDRWNEQARCWMRKLQTYKNADGSFAPVDWRLLIGLEMADIRRDRLFYQTHVEAPHAHMEAAQDALRNEAISEASRYYRKIDNPIVGRYVNSGWRHRIL